MLIIDHKSLETVSYLQALVPCTANTLARAEKIDERLEEPTPLLASLRRQ